MRGRRTGAQPATAPFEKLPTCRGHLEEGEPNSARKSDSLSTKRSGFRCAAKAVDLAYVSRTYKTSASATARLLFPSSHLLVVQHVVLGEVGVHQVGFEEHHSCQLQYLCVAPTGGRGEEREARREGHFATGLEERRPLPLSRERQRELASCIFGAEQQGKNSSLLCLETGCRGPNPKPTCASLPWRGRSRGAAARASGPSL